MSAPLPSIPAATRNHRGKRSRGPSWIEHVDEAGRRWAEPRTGFPRRGPGYDEDRFCVYCQQQFVQLGRFRRHVIDQHGAGLAKRLGLLPLDDGEALPQH